jgi:OPT family oligopeptide transporter
VIEQFKAEPSSVSETAQMLQSVSEGERDRLWYQRVYRPHLPQLTWRAAGMGMVLGGVLSITNLYAGLKTGWSFGITITAGILAFAVFRVVERIWPVAPFGELENNAMQSATSAAGFMVSAGLISFIPALMLMGGPALAPWQVAVWILSVSVLGVLVAVPLKRQMINVDQLPFPSGIAAAETIRSLHGDGETSSRKARALGVGALIGAVIAYLRDAHAAIVGKLTASYASLKGLAFGLPAQITWPGTVRGVEAEKLTLAFDLSIVLYAAGAIVGLRTALSVLLGAVINWFVIAPWLIQHQISVNGKVITGGFGRVVGWSAWPASALMVVAALVAVAWQWRAWVRGWQQLSGVWDTTAKAADTAPAQAEVPVRWVTIGLGLTAFVLIYIQNAFFGIPLFFGALAIVMALILSVMTARVAGETDIAPPVGKVSQIANAALTQGQPTLNLMTASVTVGASMHAADLLTDLKCGYLLGARPRMQFLAQLLGLVAGTLACVPAFYLLVPDARVIGERFALPGAFTARATAEGMALGLSAIPPSALQATFWAAALALVLAIAELRYPQTRRFLPSALGFGLGMVQPFYNALSIALGAVLAQVWFRRHRASADAYLVPLASGMIAGESLMAVAVIMALLMLGLA